MQSIVLQVFENDTRPRAIYEKYGFRYTGNDIPPDDECPNTILEMALPLRR
jgi:RimJ/RimL family protein N-acetyltransferase